jgi:hypothetical protein
MVVDLNYLDRLDILLGKGPGFIAKKGYGTIYWEYRKSHHA